MGVKGNSLEILESGGCAWESAGGHSTLQRTSAGLKPPDVRPGRSAGHLPRPGLAQLLPGSSRELGSWVIPEGIRTVKRTEFHDISI